MNLHPLTGEYVTHRYVSRMNFHNRIADPFENGDESRVEVCQTVKCESSHYMKVWRSVRRKSAIPITVRRFCSTK